MVAQTEQNIESRQEFQQLKTRLHRRMIDAIDLSKVVELKEDDFAIAITQPGIAICVRWSPSICLLRTARSWSKRSWTRSTVSARWNP